MYTASGSGETPLMRKHHSVGQRAWPLPKHRRIVKHPQALVIGSDQVADLHGQAIGKPGNYDKAFEQLRRMSGQTVIFQTAVSVVCQASAFQQCELVAVKVEFRQLDDAEIDRYLRAETLCGRQCKNVEGWALPSAHPSIMRPDAPMRDAAVFNDRCCVLPAFSLP